MTPKAMLAASLLCAIAFAGCTGGSDSGGGGDGTSTSTTGGSGAGGCVTGPGGTVACGNATASGSATMTSTSAGNMTTNGTGGAAMAQTVRIENDAYSPDTVTVYVGGTVTWEHHDGTRAHTVTARDGSFDSHPSCSSPALPVSDCMMEGDKFTYTFATAGQFEYYDKLNTQVTGTVLVVEQQ